MNPVRAGPRRSVAARDGSDLRILRAGGPRRARPDTPDGRTHAAPPDGLRRGRAGHRCAVDDRAGAVNRGGEHRARAALRDSACARSSPRLPAAARALERRRRCPPTRPPGHARAAAARIRRPDTRIRRPFHPSHVWIARDQAARALLRRARPIPFGEPSPATPPEKESARPLSPLAIPENYIKEGGRRMPAGHSPGGNIRRAAPA